MGPRVDITSSGIHPSLSLFLKLLFNGRMDDQKILLWNLRDGPIVRFTTTIGWSPTDGSLSFFFHMSSWRATWQTTTPGSRAHEWWILWSQGIALSLFLTAHLLKEKRNRGWAVGLLVTTPIKDLLVIHPSIEQELKKETKRRMDSWWRYVHIGEIIIFSWFQW